MKSIPTVSLQLLSVSSLIHCHSGWTVWIVLDKDSWLFSFNRNFTRNVKIQEDRLLCDHFLRAFILSPKLFSELVWDYKKFINRRKPWRPHFLSRRPQVFLLIKYRLQPGIKSNDQRAVSTNQFKRRKKIALDCVSSCWISGHYGCLTELFGCEIVKYVGWSMLGCG